MARRVERVSVCLSAAANSQSSGGEMREAVSQSARATGVSEHYGTQGERIWPKRDLGLES